MLMDPSNHSKKNTQELFKVPHGKKTKTLEVKTTQSINGSLQIQLPGSNVTKVVCTYSWKGKVSFWAFGTVGVMV